MSEQGLPAAVAPAGQVRRPVRVGYLVAGLLFVGVAGLWLLVDRDVLGVRDLRVGVPALLIVAGLIGLAVTTLNRPRRAYAARPPMPQDSEEDEA